MKVRQNKNKGFTLVELIVVIVILAILAAILVPALLGYIDRSKNQKYIIEAKDLMTASQAGIAEAYAKQPASFKRALRKNTNSPAKETPYGYYTSDILADAKNKKFLEPNKDITKENGAAAKNVISKALISYIEAGDYDFYRSTKDWLKNNQSVSELNGKVAFMIMFDEHGKILFMQYSNEGKLVTYDGTGFTVEDGGNFVKEFRN